MERSISKKTPILLFILTGSVVLLLCAGIYLYSENHSLRNRNEDLIIQNDSIMSVNIELTDSLQHGEVVRDQNKTR